MFEVYDKITLIKYKVYDINNDKNGYPHLGKIINGYGKVQKVLLLKKNIIIKKNKTIKETKKNG